MKYLKTYLGFLILMSAPLKASCQNVNNSMDSLEPQLGVSFKETRSMYSMSGQCLIALEKSIKNHNAYYSDKSKKYTIGRDVFVKAYTCDDNYNNNNTILTMLLFSGDKEFNIHLLDSQTITYLDKNYNIEKWGH